MTDEYTYRPPLKYVLVGLGCLAASAIFGLTFIKEGELWFKIVVGIFCILTLATGLVYSLLYIRKLNSVPLIIGEDFIIIPGRWKDKIRVDFNHINEIGEFDTYSKIIEIVSHHGVHLIERNWMKEKDFKAVKAKLKEYWQKK
ncbi:MAG: hypothetical protein P1U56_22885 [Saprospiraceae bacterium]|nr:hypothetical protein [Saprospiraceae bacterium]